MTKGGVQPEQVSQVSTQAGRQVMRPPPPPPTLAVERGEGRAGSLHGAAENFSEVAACKRRRTRGVYPRPTTFQLVPSVDVIGCDCQERPCLSRRAPENLSPPQVWKGA